MNEINAKILEVSRRLLFVVLKNPIDVISNGQRLVRYEPFALASLVQL